MFARDWRGVASAPADVVADPVRCVSNTAGAADDGAAVDAFAAAPEDAARLSMRKEEGVLAARA